MRRLCAWVLLVIAIAACSGTPDLEAPPPLVLDDPTDSLAPIDPSIIESEVRYDLEPAVASLEKAVPRAFGDIEKKQVVETNKRLHVAFAAARTPFVVQVTGQRVSVSTTIEYEGRGWYKPPIGPELSSACGTGANVERPRARVSIVSQLSLTPEWSLAARTRIASIEPASTEERDKCRVTIFRFDVTEKVMGATRSVLEKELANLDKNIAKVQTRARFERWWRDMSRAIRLTDSVWFTINPIDVKLTSIRTEERTMVAGLRLTARPRIETGNRPNDFDLFTPLPRLLRADSGGGQLRVTLDGEIDYGVATGMLRRALVGKEIPIANRKLTIQSVDLLGIGGGRIALGVRFTGGVVGHMYLTGTPSYDVQSDQLLIPDLAYDLRTSDALVAGLAWLKDDAIQNFLREKARFPVNNQLDRLRLLAERGMNRDLTQGVRLVGKLEKSEAVAVRASRTALRVRAVASGSAYLDIDKPLTLRPAPQKKP
ncbi:MAG: DUF4403 family protein [Cytophagaceae bacterium]|nr:DUF4403 family protein [Gemmatimonadaceae bacterium]